MTWNKCLKLLGLSLCVVFSWLCISSLFTSSASAANLGTTELTLRYFTNNGSYNTDEQIYFGRQYGKSIVYGAANIYSFYTSQVQTTGNYAVIHFETNLVISTDDISTIFGYWSNLNEIDVLNVYVNGVSYASYIVSGSTSTNITDWTTTINGITYYNSTLTVYGDVVVGNLSSGSNAIFQVVVGSQNYAFYTNNTDNPDLFYFEQNPTTIEFTSDINNALLQTQINQNNTIINQNQQTYDWLTDNSEPNVDASGLGSVGGWLPAGPVDSILTLPVVLAQGILGVFTGQHQCSPIVLPLNISGVNLTIPCLDEYFRMSGVNLIWNGVGAIISGFIIYDTFKWLYKFVDDTLTLRENNSSMWGGL